MKFSVGLQDIDAFFTNGTLEFSEIAPTDILGKISSPKNFAEGRNLWQSNEAVKKMLSRDAIPGIVGELFRERPIHLGCDQFFLRINVFEEYSLQTANLEQITSMQGVLCGAMICLSGKGEAETQGVFSAHPGNVVFITADFEIDFSLRKNLPNHEYLLAVYTKKNAVYRHSEKDPLTHYFKHYGYGYGDKFNIQTHPVIIR